MSNEPIARGATAPPQALWVAPLALAALALANAAAAPLVVIAGALAPAAAYAALIVLLARPDEPLPLLVALFFWGAAATVVAEPLNVALGAHPLGPVLWGPLVEEIAKALGLVALVSLGRERLRDVRSGIACGALVGLGFAAAENLQYHLLAAVQGGPEGLLRAVFVRGVIQGLNHATFTAFAGAGLGFARATRTGTARALAALAIGFAAGVLQHAAWNAVASYAITELLCGAPTAADACLATPSSEALFLRIPILVAGFVGPGLVALVCLARVSPPRAGPLKL